MDTAKSSSALFKSVMYHLRNDQKAIDLLGKGIKRADGSRWIYGEVNMITGKADLKFEVQGEHSKAEVRFKGHRDDEGDWLSTDYRLISGDKVIEF